jgi:hypothetical protein
MTAETTQNVTARHLSRNAYLCIRQSTVRRSSRIRKAPKGSTACASGRWPWAGGQNRLWSSIPTSGSRAPRPPIAPAFSG